MDTNTSTPTAKWKPTTEEWGLAAYAETKTKFADLIMGSDKPRAQAYALWALSHDPSLAGRELLNFRNGCGNDQPSSEHIERARSAHKPLQDTQSPATAPKDTAPKDTAPKDPKAPKKKRSSPRKGGKQLSKMEKAILANFSDANKLISSFKAAKRAVEKARKELASAAEELRSIDREKAKLLSQLDSQAAAVFKELGILG